MKYNWEKQFDEIALSKGRQLFREGKVERFYQDEKKITGEIPGTKRYTVTIMMRDGEPGLMKCQCPKRTGGRKCEHMAAVLYAAYQTEEEKKAEEERLRQKKKAEEEKEKLYAAERKRLEDYVKQQIREEEKREKEREKAREKEQEEVRKRIRQREAEKAAKRAERKRKRKEAEAAARAAEAEAAARREEELQKERKEQERKQAEAERKKQEEKEKAEQEEAERKARKEQKVQAAIARAKQKGEKEQGETRQTEERDQNRQTEKQQSGKGQSRERRTGQNALAPASAALHKPLDREKYLSWNPQTEKDEEDMTEQSEERFTYNREKIEENYSYFQTGFLCNALDISSADYKKGKRLAEDGTIAITSVQHGYISTNPEHVIQVKGLAGTGKSSFPMELTFTRNEILGHHCGCPVCRKKFWFEQQKGCQYMAGLVILLDYYLKENRVGDATDYKASSLLHTVKELRENEVAGEAHTQENSLSLVPRLMERDGFLELSFRIGDQKLFVVKNLFDLYTHVENKETAQYGTKTEIHHQIRNFTQEGVKWYQFVRMIVQDELKLQWRVEREDGYYRAADVAKGHIPLYGKNLDLFCQTLGDGEVEYEKKEASRKTRQMVRCEERIPKITMQIRKEDFGEKIFHGVHVLCRMPVFYDGADASYYLEDGTLCRVPASYMEKLELLTDHAEDGILEFVVGRDNLSEFYYMILPQLEEVVDIMEEDSETIHEYLPPEVRFVFYLDTDGHDIMCRPYAKYDSREEAMFELIRPYAASQMPHYRMVNKESEIFFRVGNIFAVTDASEECFRCGEDEANVYEVLHHGVDQLLELGEVFYTKKFRDLFTMKKMKLSVGVSVSEGMLNLDIMTDDLTSGELLDILKSYRAKKKYYRMKSGAFMSLEDDSLEMMEELMHAFNLSPKELAKGQIKCPAYRAIYLDKLLEEHEEIYNSRDSHFRKLVKNFKTIQDADYEVPASLDHVMRGYQKNGYRWLRTLESSHFGGILADDMGLGKTLQAISVLLAAKEEGRKGTSLIVCPASLVYNWGEEFGRFAPEMNVMLLAGTQQERKKMLEDYREHDVIVTSYDLLKRDIANYDGKQFLFQFIDEAQYIKNHSTAVAKAVKVIQSEYRFAMTGTPIENRLSELWSIFDYLMPGFLYGYDTFRKEIEQPIVKYQDEEAMARLQKMAGTFILRRIKENVLKDLPEKLEESRYVRMDREQQMLYDAQVVHMKQQLEGQGEEEFRKNKMKIFAELTKLRQICCDPSLCFENYKGESAKLESCLELVQNAVDGGHKILLFSQFTSMLDILDDRLNKMEIEHFIITGSTPKGKRLELVKTFNQDQTPVFLISLKAGGVGLNLTGADVVIHYDPWWNQAVQNQATDRAHRIGQTKKVVVYKVLVKHTIEEKIQKLQEKKRDLADQIVNAETGQISSLSKEELMELLGV